MTTPATSPTPIGHEGGSARESGLVFLLTLIPVSIGLSSGYLAFDNDTLYADVVRTMVETGDWLNPQIHGVPFLDKPPLFFWIGGLFVHLLGDCTLAYRLPAALGACGTAAIMYGMLRQARSPRPHAFFAVCLLLACPLFFEYARRAYMEVPVAGAILVSLHFFHGTIKDETNTRAWIGAGLWTGIGFMLKSLVGLFGALGFGALLVFQGRWHTVRLRGLWLGLLVCAMVCLPWHLYAYLSDPTVFVDFTYKLHVEDQVLDAQPWSAGPVWFYVQSLVMDTPLLGLATAIGIMGCLRQLKAPGRMNSLDALLFSALLVMLAVFSFSATKKVIYMLAFTPVAFTLAARQLQSLPMHRRWIGLLAFIVAVLWTRNIPYLDPSADFIRGSEPYAVAAKAIEGKHQAQRIHLVDQYFSAAQFYGALPATSVWTHDRIVRQTQRIPYIRHGENMVYIPRAQLADAILGTPDTIWMVSLDDAQALGLVNLGTVIYQAGGLVVIDPTNNQPKTGS